jgi:hypothetical protein
VSFVDRTALRFADTKTRAVTAMRQKGPGPVLEEVSRIFWRSAAAEFRTKMKAAESVLRFVDADIPQPAKALFAQVLKRDIESIHQRSKPPRPRAGFPRRAAGNSWSKLPAAESARSWTSSRPSPRRASLGAVGPGRTALPNIATLKALAERKAQVVSGLDSNTACRMNADIWS